VTIYVVMGQFGEYSDHTEWTVRAFHSTSNAEAFALRCKQRGDALCGESHREVTAYDVANPYPGPNQMEVWLKICDGRRELEDAVARRHELDPKFPGHTRCSNTVDYFQVAVELDES
jgi:hypothetical protein